MEGSTGSNARGTRNVFEKLFPAATVAETVSTALASDLVATQGPDGRIDASWLGFPVRFSGKLQDVSTVKRHASTILGAFEQAQTELIGKAVILTDGKAGTVENVWLDEFHGLRISIKCHDGRWPVSTIKFAQS